MYKNDIIFMYKNFGYIHLDINEPGGKRVKNSTFNVILPITPQGRYYYPLKLRDVKRFSPQNLRLYQSLFTSPHLLTILSMLSLLQTVASLRLNIT